METISLNGSWSLTGISPEGDRIHLEAHVPGSALNDVRNLAENSTFQDIFYRDHADHYLKYERYSWVYSKTFQVPHSEEHAVLCFERLDTYCDLYLNDTHIAYCDNGNIQHRFDVSKLIRDGENHLEIRFYSPVVLTENKPRRFAAFTPERLYTRRTQCSYGWDWTMRFVTCGIGCAELILDQNRMRVSSAYAYTREIDSECASIGVDIDLENADRGGTLEVELKDAHGSTVYQTRKYCQESFVRIYADLENPHLWYPLGYGEPYLYQLHIRVDGQLDYSIPFGIRTARIVQLPDSPGSANYQKCQDLKQSEFSRTYDHNEAFSGFILKINGIRILCKGANWVPCQPFSMGSTQQRITEILETAAKAGVNMIRVWGGGAFESAHFYQECSRLGILVTQDFLMACGSYPEEEEWFVQQLKREAEYAVHHLRNQTCLVWWSGDNENAVNGCDTDHNYPGRISAYKAIAPILYQKDFTRTFLPSSPFGGNKYASNTVGTTHNTQFLGALFSYIEQPDLSDYQVVFQQYNARFIAEEPSFGAVKRSSLEKIMTREDIYSGQDAMWKYHTQSNPSLARELFDYLDIFTQKVLGPYQNGEDRLFKLQYMQYEWIRISMERTRREKWFCSGIIYWMLNDCWPAASGWALIDYYVQPKAGYYAFRRGAKPVILSVDRQRSHYQISLCNDSLSEQSLQLTVYAIKDAGATANPILCSTVTTKANESYPVADIPVDEIPCGDFLVAEISDESGLVDRAFYRDGILNLTNRSHLLEHSIEENGHIRLKAHGYLHAVELECDGAVSDNYFSMLPGEVRSICADATSPIACAAYSFPPAAPEESPAPENS